MLNYQGSERDSSCAGETFSLRCLSLRDVRGVTDHAPEAVGVAGLQQHHRQGAGGAWKRSLAADVDVDECAASRAAAGCVRGVPSSATRPGAHPQPLSSPNGERTAGGGRGRRDGAHRRVLSRHRVLSGLPRGHAVLGRSRGGARATPTPTPTSLLCRRGRSIRSHCDPSRMMLGRCHTRRAADGVPECAVAGAGRRKRCGGAAESPGGAAARAAPPQRFPSRPPRGTLSPS
jgi:hypothetical protein